MIICLQEVAEHLPETAADNLVESIIRHSDLVLLVRHVQINLANITSTASGPSIGNISSTGLVLLAMTPSVG